VVAEEKGRNAIAIQGEATECFAVIGQGRDHSDTCSPADQRMPECIDPVYTAVAISAEQLGKEPAGPSAARTERRVIKGERHNIVVFLIG
jgi:hypothetical protein